MSVVKFPYVYYVTIICLLSAPGCCIRADTAVLVGALMILVDRVKCIPIYLVSFVSQYSRRWSTHKTILLVCHSHFEKIIHARNVLGSASVTIHPLPVHLRALYIMKCVKNHYIRT